MPNEPAPSPARKGGEVDNELEVKQQQSPRFGSKVSADGEVKWSALELGPTTDASKATAAAIAEGTPVAAAAAAKRTAAVTTTISTAAAATTAAAANDPPVYIAAESFQGAKKGFVFKMADRGLGYYKDYHGLDYVTEAKPSTQAAIIFVEESGQLATHGVVKTVEQLRDSIGPLPPLDAITPATHGGIGPWCSWILPDRVLAGCYPGNRDDSIHIENIEGLLDAGVGCVVCLQNELDHKCPPSKWQRGFPHLRPYIDDMRYIAEQKRLERGGPKQEPIMLIHVNMPEAGVCEDGFIEKPLKLILKQLMRGRRLYVHGFAGHGRQGVLVSLLLNAIYGIPKDRAIAYAQATHDQREDNIGENYKCPSNTKQRQQIARLCAKAKADSVKSKGRMSSNNSRVGAKPAARQSDASAVSAVPRRTGPAAAARQSKPRPAQPSKPSSGKKRASSNSSNLTSTTTDTSASAMAARRRLAKAGRENREPVGVRSDRTSNTAPAGRPRRAPLNTGAMSKKDRTRTKSMPQHPSLRPSPYAGKARAAARRPPRLGSAGKVLPGIDSNKPSKLVAASQ